MWVWGSCPHCLSGVRNSERKSEYTMALGWQQTRAWSRRQNQPHLEGELFNTDLTGIPQTELSPAQAGKWKTQRM